MNIDHSVRKAAALWASGVSGEAGTTPNHDARVILARGVCEALAPREGGQDIVSNLVILVHMFASGPEPEMAEVEALVETVMGAFVALGAFGSGGAV
jgi:hypothetical protein